MLFAAWAFIIGIVDPERTVPDVRLVNNEAAAAFEIQPACVDDDRRANEGPGTATPLWKTAVHFKLTRSFAHSPKIGTN